MNDFSDLHTPRPEFRHALEQRVVGTLQRETRYAPYYRIARNVRVRSALLIVLGAVLGVGCGYASAQVRESQTRNELLQGAEASLTAASVRLDLARLMVARAQKMFDAGVITRSELVRLQTEARLMELNLAQVNLDLEEIRASASAPRQELWAPLVNGRDFIKQRLELEAARKQEQLTAAEASLAELHGLFNTGVAAGGALENAKVDLSAAQHEFQLVAQRLALRREFIESNLKPEQIAFREKQLQAHSEMQVLQQQVKTAELRAVLARTKVKIGSATEIDLKRAELELLVLKSKILDLEIQINILQAGFQARRF